jgi:hypothetical protein
MSTENKNQPAGVNEAQGQAGLPASGGSVTVVYDIIDDAAWRDGGNPLRYQHHGLKAHTVAAYDAVELCQNMREELERLRDIVSDADVEIIDAVLRESQNAKVRRDAV